MQKIMRKCKGGGMKPLHFAKILGVVSASVISAGVAMAQTTFSPSLTNQVMIQLPSGVTDTDPTNNYDQDTDWARGSIDVTKAGLDGATISGAGPNANGTAGAEPSDTVTPSAFDVTIGDAASNYDPGAITIDDTNYNSDIAASFPITDASFDSGQTVGGSTLPAGAYSFTEDNSANEGFMASVTCTSTGTGTTFTVNGVDQSPANAGDSVTFSYNDATFSIPAGTSSFSVDLGDGEDVDCTVANENIDLEISKTFFAGACSGDGNADFASGTVTAMTDSDAAVEVLSDTQSDTFVPGTAGCYVVEIANNGSVATSGSFAFFDSQFGGTLPTGLSVVGSGCDASSGATGTTCGSFLDATAANLDISMSGTADASYPTATVVGAGEAILVYVSVSFASSLTASDTLSNTASVSDGYDPDGSLSATLQLTGSPEADLSVTKTDSTDRYTPGVGGTYVIEICNAGPSNVMGAVLTDTAQSGINLGTPVCTGAAGSATSSDALYCGIDAGATGLTFTAQVNLPAPSGGASTECAQIEVPYTPSN